MYSDFNPELTKRLFGSTKWLLGIFEGVFVELVHYFNLCSLVNYEPYNGKIYLPLNLIGSTLNHKISICHKFTTLYT